MIGRKIKRGKKIKYTFVGLTILAAVYCIYLLSKKIENDLNVKYILLWAPANHHDLFKYVDQGRETFYVRNCPINNCYLTDNKFLLKEITEYDVIVFNGPDIFGNYNVFPPKRASHQKYIFASRTSAEYCEAPNYKTNGYFNWTWTYKINSDIPMGYITIRNSFGDIIGPKEDMHWLSIDEMLPISDDVMDILDSKSVAVAWFNSNCQTLSEREKYVAKLYNELSKYELELDIYGSCGTMICPKILMDHCVYRLQIDYYFYLAFENSFNEDYVTEGILHGLQNYAVPIVYGGANYTRFMPDGIYIDATKMNAKELAQEINEIIEDTERYYTFFKWQNHYSYHYPEESFDSDPMCKLCESMHDNQLMKSKVIDQFQTWWNGDDTALLQ